MACGLYAQDDIQQKEDKFIDNVWISADAYDIFISKNPERSTDIGFGLEVAYKTDKHIVSASYHDGLSLELKPDGYNRFRLFTLTYGTPLFEKNNFFFFGRLGPSCQKGKYRVYQYPKHTDYGFQSFGLFGAIDLDIKLL